MIKQEYDFLQGATLCRCNPYDNIVKHGVEATIYKPAMQDLKKAHWLRVAYPRVASRSVAEALEIYLPKLLYDVVCIDNATLVLIYTSNYENIRGSLTLEGVGEPAVIEAADFGIGAGQTHTPRLHRRS